MSRSLLARVGVTALSVVSLLTVACSQESPSSPSVAAGGVGDLAARPEKPAGRYELTPIDADSNLLPSPQPVHTPLHFRAQVFDALTMTPASDGKVTFDYCVWRGNAAPRTKCEGDETGTWRAFSTYDLVPEGIELAVTVQHEPTTIGFRFRYRRGTIDDGIGGPLNFEWIAN